jgi:hypothetical protein
VDGLTLAQLVTVAGVASATALVDEVLWRTAAASDAIKDRFGPIVALTTGVIVAILAALTLGFGGQDLAQAVINGAVGGLAAIGVHDLFDSAGVS